MSAGSVLKAYAHVDDLPKIVPVFPLDGVLLLPRGGLPLNIFEPRYLNMVDDVMAGDRIIGMVQTRSGGGRRSSAKAWKSARTWRYGVAAESSSLSRKRHTPVSVIR